MAGQYTAFGLDVSRGIKVFFRHGVRLRGRGRAFREGFVDRAVEGDEDEGGGEERGGEVEGGGEARRAGEEAEQKRARAGSGVEGDVPEGAAEAALVLGDAVHCEE